MNRHRCARRASSYQPASLTQWVIWVYSAFPVLLDSVGMCGGEGACKCPIPNRQKIPVVLQQPASPSHWSPKTHLYVWVVHNPGVCCKAGEDLDTLVYRAYWFIRNCQKNIMRQLWDMSIAGKISTYPPWVSCISIPNGGCSCLGINRYARRGDLVGRDGLA